MSLKYLNNCILFNTTPNITRFRHSSVYYIKTLLEAKFKQTFTLNDIEGLLSEVFSEEEIGNSLIPDWYKDKWFRKE